MKNDFDPLPLRNQLVHWHNSQEAKRRVHSAVEKAQVGDSVDNPVDLPEAVAKKAVAERCDWALSLLAEERASLAVIHRAQELAGALRARLVQLKAQKQAEERASARKRLRRFSVVAALLVVVAAIVTALWWQQRTASVSTLWKPEVAGPILLILFVVLVPWLIIRAIVWCFRGGKSRKRGGGAT